ncbi:MAG: D-aminoacyl-tRNA deacylase [Promethearchaeota archaeon]
MDTKAARPVIVSSIEDIASGTIKRELIAELQWKPVLNPSGALEILHEDKFDAWLITVEEPLVQADKLDDYCREAGLNPLCYIFISRHKSATGNPALLTHVTGNWGERADLGGNPYQVCRSSSALLRIAFMELISQKEKNQVELEKFAINLEATHHGPTNLQHPLLYVELGSDEVNWNDEAGAKAVLNVVLKLLSALNDAGFNLENLARNRLNGTGIGLGGPHYAATFDRVMRSTNIGFSHVIPKHAIATITREVIELAVTNSIEPVSWFVLDWKGLNKAQKDVLLPILETFPIPVKRAKHLEKELMVPIDSNRGDVR